MAERLKKISGTEFPLPVSSTFGILRVDTTASVVSTRRFLRLVRIVVRSFYPDR
jgi:hypothetical protein